MQGGSDGLVNAVGIAKHIMVPESKHSIAFVFEDVRPRQVCRAGVLTSIDFDDQLAPMAREVGDKVPDRHLTTKVRVWKCFS